MTTVVAASHGKSSMLFYRVTRCADTGDDNVDAYGVDVRLAARAWDDAYAHGVNTGLVATDSIRNMVASLVPTLPADAVAGAVALARAFADEYPDVDSVCAEVTAPELRPTRVQPPGSPALYEIDGSAPQRFAIARCEGGSVSIDLGWRGLRYFKTGASAFAGFRRDRHTRLPDANDRPLLVHLDLSAVIDAAVWPSVGTTPSLDRLRETTTDVVASTASRSIQHLIHEIGAAILARDDRIARVDLTAQNRTPLEWMPANDAPVRVLTHAAAEVGTIAASITR